MSPPTPDMGPAPGPAPGPDDAPRIDLERELGRGASGRVELGTLRQAFGSWPAGAEVAVKRLHPELAGDPEACRALESEALLGQHLDHPSLAEVLYHGVDEAGPFVVMEYVPGRSLEELLEDEGPQPEPLVRALGSQVASALAALHAAGSVHGDLKPENLRLDSKGRATLLDLGLSRRLTDEDEARSGSLPWLSPEEVAGGRPSEASDLFALGVVLFELATGHHPFDPELSASEPRAPALRPRELNVTPRRREPTALADRLLESIARARCIAPSSLVPELSPFFDALLFALLARNPAERPSGAEVSRRLAEGEAGEWWRSRLEGSPKERRSREGDVHLTPIVGREAELEALFESVAHWSGPQGTEGADAEAGGMGSVLWLTGPAGSGKSRLVGAFVEQLRARPDPPVYLYARCSEQADSRPFGSLLILLRRWLQLPGETKASLREEQRLAQLVPPRELETLLEALDTTAESAIAGSIPEALSVWLERVAENHPVVVFIDDLHLAGEGSLTGAGHLVDELAGAPLLLILGLREDEPARRPEALASLQRRVAHLAEGGVRERGIDLLPLTEQAVERLVTKLFHHRVPRLRLAHELWLRSRGNPGLIAEILRGLLARGEAHPHSDTDPSLVLTVPIEKLPLPSSLNRAITERYRALEPEDRRWLERLAVVGGRIDAEFLVRAFPPTTQAELTPVLSRLVRTGWLVPAGPRYRFARPALREAVYRTLSSERRQRLHERAAEALAPENPRSAPLELSFQYAFHLRAAQAHDELVEVLEPLVRGFRDLSQPQRVFSLARWGLEALDQLTETPRTSRRKLEFLELAADAANRLGRRTEERRLLDRLAALEVDPDEEPEEASRVYLLHGRYALSTGQYGLARGMLRHAREMARGLEDQTLHSDALRRLADVQAYAGEIEEARQLAAAAEGAATSDLQRVLALAAGAQIEILDNWLERALALVERARSILRKLESGGPPGARGALDMLRARALRSAGRQARALASASLALRLARQAGERRLEMEAAGRLGILLLELGRDEDAEVRLRDAHFLARDIEDRSGEALVELWLGILLWEVDDPETERRLERASTSAADVGTLRVEAMARAFQARIDYQHGRLPQALAHSERATTLLDSTGAEAFDRIVITGTRALVLAGAGKGGEARSLVRTLRRRLRRENERLEDAELRRDQRRYSTRLLEAVLSDQGPVYPRVGLEPA